jgi:hypothetical protein
MIRATIASTAPGSLIVAKGAVIVGRSKVPVLKKEKLELWYVVLLL